MKKDEIYLRHVYEAIQQIGEYLAGIDRKTFDEDRKTQDAVVRQLEIIGEASRRLSKAFCNHHDGIPWKAIVGMRNRIAHDYLNIDLQVIWEAVQYDLPSLKAFVSGFLD